MLPIQDALKRRKEIREAAREEGRREWDQRFAEADVRFGFYDAKGQRLLPLTPEVRRFLKGDGDGDGGLAASPTRKWRILGRKGLGWGRGARLE